MSDSGFASLGPTLLARKGGAKPAMRPQLPVLSEPAEVAKLADEQLEDLGWNDMGDDDAARTDNPVVVPIDRDTPFDAEAAAASPIVRRQQRRLEERVLADAVMTGPEDDASDDASEEPDLANHHSEDNASAFGYAAYGDDDGDDEDCGEYAAFGAQPYENKDETESESELSYPVIAAAQPATPAKPAKPAPASARRAAFTLRLDPERHLKLRLAATMKGISAQALVTQALDAMLAEFDELDVIAAHLQRH